MRNDTHLAIDNSGRSSRGAHRPPERRLVRVLLRRPARLHDPVREPRRRGCARPPLALLRHEPASDRALQRHRREVHRRRGDGRLGHAVRNRGRRGAGRAGRAGSCDLGRGAGRGVRRIRSELAGRRPDRRGCRYGRSRGPGDGGRRPRQHGGPGPGGGPARHGPRRRCDAPLERADDPLRGSRRP